MILTPKFRTLHVMPGDFRQVRLFGESYATGWTAYEAWEEGPEGTDLFSAVAAGIIVAPPS